MRFEVLRYLAREESSDRIELEAACALGLPMPEDVLEQFVIDHGVKNEFQRAYVELDLTVVQWSQEELEVPKIRGCSSKYDDHVCNVETWAAQRVESGSEDSVHWRTAKTWLRSPVFLDGVIGEGMHLVEGHTRVGMLLGLSAAGFAVKDKHKCWVGRIQYDTLDVNWVHALKTYPIAFHSWLQDGPGNGEDPRDAVASKLSRLKSSMRYQRSFGNDVDDLIEVASYAKNPSELQAQVRTLAAQWRQELERVAACEQVRVFRAEEDD